MDHPGNKRGPRRGADFAAMRAHAGEAANLLRALGNEQRLLILCALAEGERTVSTLNEHVPLSQSALSQHLAVLRRDGVVEARREAQNVFYSLAPGPAAELLGVLHDLYCGPPLRRKRRR